jgi:aminopeptidase N
MAFLGVRSLADPVVVAHETAHQWFYGLVGSDQIQAPWLDEALAEFAATDLYDTAERPCEPGPVASPVTAFPARRDTLECGGYGDTVYRGGAALVARVRAHLGNERFDDAMRTYVEQNTGRIATTDDLVEVWLSASDDATGLRAQIDKALFG